MAAEAEPATADIPDIFPRGAARFFKKSMGEVALSLKTRCDSMRSPTPNHKLAEQ
jgi:hypothetical protein